MLQPMAGDPRFDDQAVARVLSQRVSQVCSIARGEAMHEEESRLAEILRMRPIQQIGNLRPVDDSVFAARQKSH